MIKNLLSATLFLFFAGSSGMEMNRNLEQESSIENIENLRQAVLSAEQDRCAAEQKLDTLISKRANADLAPYLYEESKLLYQSAKTALEIELLNGEIAAGFVPISPASEMERLYSEYTDAVAKANQLWKTYNKNLSIFQKAEEIYVGYTLLERQIEEARQELVSADQKLAESKQKLEALSQCLLLPK